MDWTTLPGNIQRLMIAVPFHVRAIPLLWYIVATRISQWQRYHNQSPVTLSCPEKQNWMREFCCGINIAVNKKETKNFLKSENYKHFLLIFKTGVMSDMDDVANRTP